LQLAEKVKKSRELDNPTTSYHDCYQYQPQFDWHIDLTQITVTECPITAVWVLTERQPLAASKKLPGCTQRIAFAAFQTILKAKF
jgi:hypothetical protein